MVVLFLLAEMLCFTVDEFAIFCPPVDITVFDCRVPGFTVQCAGQATVVVSDSPFTCNTG